MMGLAQREGRESAHETRARGSRTPPRGRDPALVRLGPAPVRMVRPDRRLPRPGDDLPQARRLPRDALLRTGPTLPLDHARGESGGYAHPRRRGRRPEPRPAGPDPLPPRRLALRDAGILGSPA